MSSSKPRPRPCRQSSRRSSTADPKASPASSTSSARVDDICGEGEFLRKHAHRIINHLHGLLNDREHLEEFRITNAIDDLMLIIEELKKQRPEDPFLKRAATWTWTFFKKNVAVVYVSGIAITALPNADEVLEFVAREVHAITAGEEHAADAADDAETDADGAP